MTTTRSRTGCMTCRKRWELAPLYNQHVIKQLCSKLKCDEQRPICGQCTKASRECIPSEGVVFRNQQNPSMNSAGGGGGGGNLSSFFSYKNTFRNDAIWVDIPSTSPVSLYSVAARLLTIWRSLVCPRIRPLRRWPKRRNPTHDPSQWSDLLVPEHSVPQSWSSVNSSYCESSVIYSAKLIRWSGWQLCSLQQLPLRLFAA